MGGGNGAKAAQKRERNAKEAAKAGGKSQLKSNQASQTIKCTVCFTTMQSTSSMAILKSHAENKHSKTVEQCFPGIAVS